MTTHHLLLHPPLPNPHQHLTPPRNALGLGPSLPLCLLAPCTWPCLLLATGVPLQQLPRLLQGPKIKQLQLACRAMTLPLL